MNKRYVIKQTTANMLNLKPEECIGEKIYISDQEGICIGVVGDFHFSSLKNRVEPLVFDLNESFIRNLIIRFGDGDVLSTLNFMEEKWKQLIPGKLFDYLFLNESFDNLYKNDRRAGKLFAGFTFLAILIACLGLFGLSVFETQVKTKEIGIRKVMGSSSFRIFGLLIKSFTNLIAISFLISVPITVFIMRGWLSRFAYRIEIGIMEFFIAAFTIFIILLISVGYHTMIAAFRNPVEALRYE
jgi:putative ABC transport system permease protein